MLDKVRGTMTRSAWVRDQIRKAAKTPTGLVTRPTVESAGEDPAPWEGEKRLTTREHRHTIGVLIEEWYDKGTQKRMYRCAEPTCAKTMIR